MKLPMKTAAIYLVALISTSAFAQAPVTDATVNTASNAELLKRIDDLTRVMTVRNKMQVRFQSQLDELAQEVSEMKGSLELFENQLNQIENRQRTLFQMIEESKQAAQAATVQPATEVVSGAVGTAGGEQAVYQKAVDLVLTEKQYDKAIAAFSDFVVDYPESTYVPNAQYWLGQLLYKDRKREKARAAFLVVTDKYPESNKRADSLYKIGIIDEYDGKTDSAKSFYKKVMSEYPASSAAGLAEKRLNAL